MSVIKKEPEILVYRSKEGVTGMKLVEGHEITWDNLPQIGWNFTVKGILYNCNGITMDYDMNKLFIFATEIRPTKGNT